MRHLLVLPAILLTLAALLAGPALAQDPTDEPTEEATASEEPTEEATASEEATEEATASEAPTEEATEAPTDAATEGDDAEAPTGAPATGQGGSSSSTMPILLTALAVGLAALAVTVRLYRAQR